ncbi:PepSY-associated TM helix domain-containing protein [Ectobacillus panaciterrae]|uniref:PepSY-associated TM helix domain-containing protein n=1 Tax=Ectobacillus panaciterrae TaxID=363872 RepID=UPI000412E501|nr:PepSY domain-containing protein [Ectobacillus panaciterrae]
MSLQQERPDYTKEPTVKQELSKVQSLYRAVWRWHFYAGIVFAPFVILLAITGIIYLFKPQIENVIYKDYYYVQAQQKQLTTEQQIEAVKKKYSDASVTRYKPSFEADRSSEVGIAGKAGMMTVFVNPYNGKILGDLKNDEKFMNEVESLHGKLMIGTTGDRIVEMAACWAMILLITGLYLWWPRNKKDIFGTLIPRLSKGKRIMLRDLHAVPAFWFSLFVSIFILTGLPWSGLWGGLINRVATATQTGYPTGLWDGNVPQSTVPSKDVAKVPWAAENLPVPESNQSGVSPLAVAQIMKIADENKVGKGYSITFPKGEKGVYTVAVSPDKPEGQATLHIDQYSGKVLADLRFKDYGILAKAISIGVALHEGRYFGLANQLLDLIICLGLIGISLTGIMMWWKRKPSGTLGAPSLPKNFRLLKGVTILIIILGIIFPLVGASFLVVLALDWLIIKRIPVVKQWIG